MAVHRPNPLLWVWYAFGGRLPDRYRTWVRYDTRARSWLAREISRLVVRALPVMAAIVVVLSLVLTLPWWASVLVAIAGLLFTLFLTVPTADEFCRARLVRHGYPADIGPRFGQPAPVDRDRDRGESR